ncbi:MULTISPECIES: 23S rRNA (uracil(1939)-C(5))-methyltransferase RlmD [unclassified Oceanobacter]|uniref:23S rRNA (uracil(1939)-C(5))-methyltransferase RlmD n=1 Tax=unclassified Oceanobacter TaxID=2620260 RepID=UPI0026E1A9D9|nr:MULTISPECIES: 23S rRNA (uracil(1939)-C(5))-methyltransferase RlmD [unclassified Oceanobacter]MDO6682577.1 23S rRNA (uracil(1939)-C(5))-methyltransferase RlmD [Oceanobacter sp. 5_MG-2023]MDP2506793.1 23S rRNA (uracil(1939)-C(5))-methyltransferase RlmD [Oceanobacter sp. 3_MG-2023]MDP2547898.1 23S rRNA (uracil(1939)-C(5))-methyltransferase RlmD [Oceanobacter sp. 4_MG-2023]MDP2608810.1 23S rRNA (uracil(1939)-C(5))-methyltransferase RlmD [Oceanobacter sp. 1_MG-2023]MDP2611948.1 23S rRNA (uracil(
MATAKTLQLNIDNMTSDGQGVARLGRDVYFVPGALPGEQVTARLDGRRKKVWMTKLTTIDTMSPDRVTPACPHYQRCGGCDLQHLSYPAQVTFKQQRVEREFSRQGLIVPEWTTPITAEPWGYRRKARLGVRFSKNKQRNFLGFREAASEHLTNIDRCPVLPALPALDWSRWRECISTLQGRDHITQIEVVAADSALALVFRILKPLSLADQKILCAQAEALTGDSLLQLWLNPGRDEPSVCIFPDQPVDLVHFVDEQPLKMQLSDFFQVNGPVNRAMVQQALDWLQPQSEDVIWDLFAGHGNFSMPLARRSQQVCAVEVQESMIGSLQRQAESLALSLHAIEADLSNTGVLAHLPAPDKVLLDPPRAGAAALMQELNTRQVSQVLYVSCDAATLARDLSTLVAGGYQIEKAGIMDMFPQTHHVETMVLLRYKDKRRG